MNILIQQTSIFKAWLDNQDLIVQLRVAKAIDKARLGNFGDHKSVGKGVQEMRLHFGSGYRLYYAQRARCIYLLISAGDKSTQSKDIKKAISIWDEINQELS